MKKLILILVAFLACTALYAQNKPIKVVFDVTSKSTAIHESTVRHVTFMSNTYENSEYEVVIYSGALNMLLKAKSTAADQIAELIKKDNVTFVVCQGTMNRYKATTADLIDGVVQVPDGLLEIVEKQTAGWSYIKEAQ